MASKQADAIQSIDDFLSTVNAQATKQGEANTEAGGYQGSTTHPVKDVDDRTEPGKTGFRSSENAKDNKAEPNRGDATVDNTAEASTSTQSGNFDQDDVQLNIGTQQAATGEDPSVETGSTKATKEDGGYDGASSHPARTDNSALDGHKYAAAESMTLEQLAAGIQKVGNDLVGAIAGASLNGQPKKGDDEEDDAEHEQAETKKKEKAEHMPGGYEFGKESRDVSAAANAGAELAAMLNADGSINPQFDKRAADAMVEQFLYDTIKTAEEDALRVAQYEVSYDAAMRKRAMGGEEMMAGGQPPMEAAMGGGGGEGEEGEEGEEGGEGDEQAMLAALMGGMGGEGGGGGGGGPEGMMGGGGMAEMMGGGGAEGMTGEAGPEGAMGEAGGGGGQENEMAMLQQILSELEQEQPGAAKQVEAALKKASVGSKKSSDKKANMKAYLKELIGRSR